MPYLPEVYLRSRDLQYVKGVLSGRIMGAPAGCFTDEDIETFKYTFSGAGKLFYIFDDFTVHLFFYNKNKFLNLFFIF